MAIIEVLIAYPGLLIGFALILGLLVGSFLNVVIYRLPVMMEREWQQQCQELLAEQQGSEPQSESVFNLAIPRSSCPKCGHQITALENIPVLSYLWLKGRCSGCQTPISARYPLVELATGLISALIAYQFGATELLAPLLLMSWVLIALTMIDFDHQLLPDSLTLPLLWLGLIVNAFGLITDLHSALWGAVAGYLSLWSIYWAFKLLTGKEGMGYGDFKLLAALGAWMGWQMLPLIVVLSSLVGAIIGITLTIVKGRDHQQPMPFGPFLAIAGGIALLWGPLLVSQYLQMLG
ncbi:prepilin peptidase [Motiliproteus coralliicola]|uniref:Prepilin leader peptidase/N-methyltransferase n=1 Tax=Motiliproteus coralliicola TaxID=2283196 RepID=A0A369WQB1_9GAMM|nr:A24 family peptidase [Motiliproteus coralliicola]RDE22804.1 prepilin peptidase [Motiliproteus coralliicola]